MMSRFPFAYLVVLLVCSVSVRASEESSQLPVHSSQSTAEHQPTTDNRSLPADNACVSCHQNLTGRLGAVVQEWAQSVHFRNKVTCDGCHGGDPAVKREECADDEAFKNRSHQHRTRELSFVNRPEEQFTSTVRGRSVSYFCGKCHEQIKEKHLGSPHGDLHAIMESKVDIIDLRPLSQGGRCAVCHRAATMETVAQIYKSLVNAENQLKVASEQYGRLETFGYKNLALQKMYGHTRETLSQLRRSFHSFNMREINEAASTIKTSAQLTQDTYDMIQALEGVKGRQAFIGIAAVVFLLSFAGLLLVYRQRYLH
jgi:cytochrome c553